MTGVTTKTFDDPDETRPFADKGMAQVVDVGGGVVLKGQFDPGWRWSEHLGPVVGTDSCQSPHHLYVLSGRMRVRMNDGSETEIGPNAVARIEPGHDAWVVGDKPCVVVDFGASSAYAQPAAG